MSVPRLFLITDRAIAPGGDLVAAARKAVSGGVGAVQLREKDLSGRELFRLACELREAIEPVGARLLVNDRADVAKACGAGGVHLSGTSLCVREARLFLGKSVLIGVSTHHEEEVAAARDAGADYVVFGPVFDTPSKRAYGEPKGVDALRRACASAPGFPVLGLGGISTRNAAEVLRAGAHGIALIRGILASDDPSMRATEYMDAIKTERRDTT